MQMEQLDCSKTKSVNILLYLHLPCTSKLRRIASVCSVFCISFWNNNSWKRKERLHKGESVSKISELGGLEKCSEIGRLCTKTVCNETLKKNVKKIMTRNEYEILGKIIYVSFRENRMSISGWIFQEKTLKFHLKSLRRMRVWIYCKRSFWLALTCRKSAGGLANRALKWITVCCHEECFWIQEKLL